MDKELITATKEDLTTVVNNVVNDVITEKMSVVKEDLQREIKSNITPQMMTSNIQVKSEAVDKHLFGTVARMIVKSNIDRTNIQDTISKYVNDSYVQSAVTKTMTVATPEAGGFLIPTTYATQFIESLKAQSVVRQAGAQILPMPQGNLTLRKWTDGSDALWEGESTGGPSMDGTTGVISLNSKKLIGQVIISNELSNDTSGQVDSYLQNMLLYKLANKEDVTFLVGAVAANSPTGILTQVASANKFAMTATPTFEKARKDIIKLVNYVKKNNVQTVKPGFVISPSTKYALIGATPDNNTYQDFFKSLNDGILMGYPVYETTNITDSLVMFGDFQKAVIGETQGISIVSSMDNRFTTDETVIKATLREDFGLTYDVAFSVLTGVTWSTAL